MKGFDEWATDPENKGVYPRGRKTDESEDDNICVDTSYIKEEDGEIKSLIPSESNKGGEDMDKFECLAGGKKCTNCGYHETSMAICATEDSVGNKFLGWIPKEKTPQGIERRTGVTIKKE